MNIYIPKNPGDNSAINISYEKSEYFIINSSNNPFQF